MTTEPAEAQPTSPQPPTSGLPLSEAAGPEQDFIAPDGPTPTESTVETAVSIRRVPKYPRFVILGGGLGAIITFILTASFPSDPTVGFGALLGYFLIFGVPIGMVLGALVAIGLDLAWRLRAREGVAAHTTVDPLPYEGELDEEPELNEEPEPAPEPK